MIVLLGDGIQTLFPNLDLLTTRVISFCVLTPTVFISIKKLAYTSLIGIIGCVSLVVIVFYDGISKETRPGSLHDPMVRVHTQKKIYTFVYILTPTYYIFRTQKLFHMIFLICP